MRRGLVAAALLAIALGCGVGFKAPYSAAQLASSQHPDKALVRYLAQRSPDVDVCRLDRSDGPSVPWVDARVVRAMEVALSKGEVSPDVYADCSVNLWATAPNVRVDLAGALIGQLGRVVRASEPDQAFDELQALERVLRLRTADVPLPLSKVQKLIARIPSASARASSAPTRELLSSLQASLEVELGYYEGEEVKRATIARQEDPSVLSDWARRLPDLELRAVAAERAVSLGIERSPFTWVREQAAEVRAALDEHGYLPIPDDFEIMAATWEPGEDDAVLLRLQQDLRKGERRLVAARKDHSLPPDPGLDLRESLQVRVRELEQPITLCSEGAPFSPTPCLPIRRLDLVHDFAWLLPSGQVRFDRELSTEELLKLSRDGDRLRAQLMVGGVVLDLDLELYYDTVAPLVYVPLDASIDAPDLKVQAWELPGERVLLEVAHSWKPDKPVVALIPSYDRVFQVVTRGGPGKTGARGAEGSPGTPGRAGSPARCPSTPATDGGSGGPGGAGGPGGVGGVGGRGGDVALLLHCDACSAFERRLRAMVLSEGGPGGEGGSGGVGPGGRGGPGGASATCTVDGRRVELPAGRTGSSGQAGNQGMKGREGPPGKPGNYRVRIAKD